LDHGLGLDTALDGAVGGALVAGAIMAAAVQLAIFHRPETAA
jgi:hypothetical protein